MGRASRNPASPASVFPLRYFSDDAWNRHEVRTAIEDAFKKLEAHLASGKHVVLPADGIGTGLAELLTRAPKFFARLEKWIAVLEARGNQPD